jgi:hypothetical protein
MLLVVLISFATCSLFPLARAHICRVKMKAKERRAARRAARMELATLKSRETAMKKTKTMRMWTMRTMMRLLKQAKLK